MKLGDTAELSVHYGSHHMCCRLKLESFDTSAVRRNLVVGSRHNCAVSACLVAARPAARRNQRCYSCRGNGALQGCCVWDLTFILSVATDRPHPRCDAQVCAGAADSGACRHEESTKAKRKVSVRVLCLSSLVTEHSEPALPRLDMPRRTPLYLNLAACQLRLATVESDNTLASYAKANCTKVAQRSCHLSSSFSRCLRWIRRTRRFDDQSCLPRSILVGILQKRMFATYSPGL